MRIAFTSKGKDWDSSMEPRFGRTEFILVYDEEKDTLIDFDNREIASDAHGTGPKTAQKLFERQVDILITGNGPGDHAATVLKQAGIMVRTGAKNMSVREAYDAFKNEKLIMNRE